MTNIQFDVWITFWWICLWMKKCGNNCSIKLKSDLIMERDAWGQIESIILWIHKLKFFTWWMNLKLHFLNSKKIIYMPIMFSMIGWCPFSWTFKKSSFHPNFFNQLRCIILTFFIHWMFVTLIRDTLKIWNNLQMWSISLSMTRLLILLFHTPLVLVTTNTLLVLCL